MATVHSIEKERQRRREKRASSELAETIRNIRLVPYPQPDLFASQQRIPRLFHCWDCRTNFSVDQPVEGPADPAICTKCGRPV